MFKFFALPELFWRTRMVRLEPPEFGSPIWHTFCSPFYTCRTCENYGEASLISVLDRIIALGCNLLHSCVKKNPCFSSAFFFTNKLLPTPQNVSFLLVNRKPEICRFFVPETRDFVDNIPFPFVYETLCWIVQPFSLDFYMVMRFCFFMKAWARARSGLPLNLIAIWFLLKLLGFETFRICLIKFVCKQNVGQISLTQWHFSLTATSRERKREQNGLFGEAARGDSLEAKLQGHTLVMLHGLRG